MLHVEPNICFQQCMGLNFYVHLLYFTFNAFDTLTHVLIFMLIDSDDLLNNFVTVPWFFVVLADY